MSDTTDKALAYSAGKELETYGNAVVTTAELSAPSVMKLIGLLQLCSRHPNLSAENQKFISTMVGHLQNGFRPEHTAIAELIRRGWDQEDDKEFAV